MIVRLHPYARYVRGQLTHYTSAGWGADTAIGQVQLVNVLLCHPGPTSNPDVLFNFIQDWDKGGGSVCTEAANILENEARLMSL